MWINKINFSQVSKIDYLVITFGGIILALAHPPVSIPYVSIFVLASIGQYWHMKKPKQRAGFFLGWFFGFGYFFISLLWIIEPFLVRPEKTGILAPFALILLAAFLSTFWGLAFWCTSLKNDYESKFKSLLKLAAFLSLAELLRSFLFTGFPWVILGVSFVETPLGQTLSIFGPYWLTSIIIFLSFSGLIGVKGFLIAAISFSTLALYGEIRLKENIRLEPVVKVRIVQPNINQKIKWHPDLASSHLKKLIKISQNNLAEIDLIIWPETAVQFFLEYQKDFSNQVSKNIGKAMILGARKYSKENHELFNSAYVLNNEGKIQDSYDKKHLVPFGEYIPFAPLVKGFGFWGLENHEITGFSVGKRPSKIHFADLPTFAIMICYESIFSYEVDENISGADWLIHLTNDAWFGSYSGPQQHLMHAQARAIEQGLSLLRSANTGISAAIDPHGRIVSRLNLNTQGYFDVELSRKIDTIYSSWGAKKWNTLLFSIIVFVIFLCFKSDQKAVRMRKL